MRMLRRSSCCSKTRVRCARNSKGQKRSGWRSKPSWKADGGSGSRCIVAAAVARPAAAKKQEGGAMLRITTAVALVALFALSSGVRAQLPPLTSIGTAHEKVLAELLDKNQPDDAARYWGENRSYFWDNAEQHKALLARLKSAVNPPHEARMNEAIELLKPFSAQPLPLADWANVIRSLSVARMALDSYRALPIAIDDTLRSERFIALDGALGEVTQVYVANAPAAFAQYDHFGNPLFTRTYPVDVPDEVIASGYLAMKPRFETASAAEIAKFNDGYAKILTGKQREELARFAMQARYRELVPGGKLTAEAAAKLITEMSAESGGGLSFSLDPIALVAGLAKEAYTQAKTFAAKANLKTAQDQLAATPRMLTEDVMGDYQYAIIDVEVTRRLPLAIYVIDVKANGYLKQTTDITEKQRFEAVDGLHPRDPERDQILSRFPASSAINQYVATPVSIEAGSVLSAALGVMQGEVAAQPMTTLAQDIERGAIQSPLAAMLASAGHCDAFFDNLVEQLKNGRCAAEAESLKGFVEAVGGPSRSAADTGILSTARTPDLYKSVPANDERWMTVGESAQPNCSAPLAVRSPQDTFMECVRVISCGARAAACGRELTRQNRNMACPEASQRCMVVYPIPQ